MTRKRVRDKEYIDTLELAKRWNKSNKTIIHWRTHNKGPGYYRFGKGVRNKVWYDLDEIREFEKTKLDTPTYFKTADSLNLDELD